MQAQNGAAQPKLVTAEEQGRTAWAAGQSTLEGDKRVCYVDNLRACCKKQYFLHSGSRSSHT